MLKSAYKLWLGSVLAAGSFPLHAQTNIYPLPHEIRVGAEKVDVSGGIQLVGAEQADTRAVKLVRDHFKTDGKIKLYIGEKGDKRTGKFKVSIPELSGAYYLKVSPKEIAVIGADERGTFYGVQTLIQLLADGNLTEAEITDYPDIRFRGTVEGFYGKPWSHRDRLAQLEFYGKHKLNTYIYGPKDDPYHSSPNWRKPYPENEARQISELACAARENHVDFVWAIHPGVDIKWNEEDFENLLNKFEMMYGLGVRSFAVFFDDISGDGTDPHKQASLLNRLNREFVQVKGDVTPLIMCPTEYNKSWANPSSNGYLSILGRELDRSVEVMWTGDRVCDDITTETLAWINERIQRPTYIWWNFPVTDYVRHMMLQGPSYGLTSEAKGNMNGFVSNPMENAEGSKIALFGVADYTWNVKGYDPLQTWEEGLRRLMPGAPEAYRTFAIHSADLEQNGHGYRRDESWEIADRMQRHLEGKEKHRDLIFAEYKSISEAPAKILASGADPYLLEELKPWLVQFEKLGQRGMAVMQLSDLYEGEARPEFWRAFVAGEMSDEERKAYNTNKSGTFVMQPFIDRTREALALSFYTGLANETRPVVTPITSFQRKETLSQMLDKKNDTYFYSWGVQRPGAWIGVDLGVTTRVTNIEILQGRKDGDKDMFRKAILEVSGDNRSWTVLGDTLTDAYAIHYNARPVSARYVRLRALDGCSHKNWTAIRRFEVNPQQKDPVVYTNLPQIASNPVLNEGRKTGLKPLLEVVNVAPGEYFGIELPMISEIRRVVCDLNAGRTDIEHSLDGETWEKGKPSKARYIRFINRTNKNTAVNLRKFEVELAAKNDGDRLMAFDGDFATGFNPQGTSFVVNRPPDVTGVTLLFGEGEFSLYTNGNMQITSDEGYIAAELSPETEQIRITGKGDLREIIWRKK